MIKIEILTNLPCTYNLIKHLHREMYKLFLKHGKTFITDYETIRKKYPEDFDYEYSPDYSNEAICVWCDPKEKKDIFAYGDLRNTCRPWCTFMVDLRLNNLAATNFCPCLSGSYLKQISRLNRFIFTVASTNHPEKAGFEEMYLTFYANRSLVERLALYVDTLSSQCTYAFYDWKKEELKKSNYTKHTDFCLKSIFSKKLEVHPCGQELVDHANTELVIMCIVDGFSTRRTLYQVILDFFKPFDDPVLKRPHPNDNIAHTVKRRRLS